MSSRGETSSSAVEIALCGDYVSFKGSSRLEMELDPDNFY